MCAFGELWWIFVAVGVLSAAVSKVIAWREITGRDYEDAGKYMPWII